MQVSHMHIKVCLEIKALSRHKMEQGTILVISHVLLLRNKMKESNE